MHLLQGGDRTDSAKALVGPDSSERGRANGQLRLRHRLALRCLRRSCPFARPRSELSGPTRAFEATRSSPPVIPSVFVIFPLVWSTMTSENLSPFIVYTESCSFPFSTSNLAEIGVPSRALAERPFSSETLAALRASASSARSFSSFFCAQSVEPLNSPTSNALVTITNPTFFLMTYSSFRPDLDFWNSWRRERRKHVSLLRDLDPRSST